MSDPSQTSAWNQRLRPMAAEMSRMVALRRELAQLEIAHDKKLITRGVVGIGIGAVVLLLGSSLLLQAVAQGLASETVSATTWTVIIGTTLFVPGVLLLARTIHKVRTQFCGLQGTLAELNEDLVWLREWAQANEGERL